MMIGHDEYRMSGALKYLCVPALMLFFGVLLGCGTMNDGRGWGEETTLAPGWERVRQAAWHAAIAPGTWAPGAGALALGINRADQKVQNWAAARTPVFGSRENAARKSDVLWSASSVIWLGTGIAAPSGVEPGVWLVNKAKGIGVETGAGMALRSFVGSVKNRADRTSPSGENQDSYLSVHGAGSAFYATLASRHMDSFDLSGGAVTATRLGLGTLAAATSWARVEADRHYPADVLKSIALGHFMGAFITGAFISDPFGRNTVVLFEPSKSGMTAKVLFTF